MPKPLIIPGWPNPTTAQVKLFQRNNRIDVDGIVGPQTMGACWRDSGIARYTFLSWSGRGNGSAKSTKSYVSLALPKMDLPLRSCDMFTVLGLLSSDWETGFDFLSTQDSITFGFRRYAAGTLNRFINEHKELFRKHLGAWGLHRVCTDLRDRPNNAWPLDEPYLRAGMIEAANDQEIWQAQLEEAVDWVKEVLDRYPKWRSGRTIALAMRVGNSASGKVRHLPQDDQEAYDELEEWYVLRGGRGPARVERIEQLIPKGEMWR